MLTYICLEQPLPHHIGSNINLDDMILKTHIAYLCGYFSTSRNLQQHELEASGWKRIFCTDKDYGAYSNFYYPEFVAFCHQTAAKHNERSVTKYRKTLGTPVTLSLFGRKMHTVTVTDVTLYEMPCKLLLYSMRIEQTDADADDVTASMSILRNITRYDHDAISREWFAVMDMLDALHTEYSSHDTATTDDCTNNSYQQLIENGNKFKIFQIALTTTPVEYDAGQQLLFEMGTFAPIGSCDTASPDGTSREYYTSILSRNKLSVFNNWTALSLLDSFTIVGHNVKQWQIDNWQSDYFEMIYTHAIFRKLYIYRTNLLFRQNACRTSQLVDQFIDFEHFYCFNKISYNFLPLEIQKAIDNGLEINEEKNQIYHIIEQDNNQQEKTSDKKMNNILIFLTFLTLFSTLWDCASLLDSILPYETAIGSTITGYRIVTGIFIAVTAITILINRMKKP